MTDEELKSRLLELISRHKFLEKILMSSDYRVLREVPDNYAIYNELMARTSFVPADHKFMSRVYMFLNGMTDFPVCPVTGRKLNLPKDFIDFKRGFRKFSNKSAAAKFNLRRADVIEKRKLVRNAHIAEDPDYWKKREAKSKATKVSRGYSPNWNNSAGRAETNFAKYGCVTPLHNEEIEQRVKAEFKDRYGNECIFKTDHFKAKAVETNRKHLGVDWPMQSEAVREKSRQTSRKIYGCDYPMQSEFVKHRASETNMKTYGGKSTMHSAVVVEKSRRTNVSRRGVDWPVQDPEIRHKQRCRYVKDGVSYDSALEIEYAIALADNGIVFEYQPESSFWYESSGKKHRYYPDFKVFSADGSFKFVEVKGAQFFKPDGTMFCPYRKKCWSDEQYVDRCRQEETKRQCMLANDVKIIRSDSEEIKSIRKYIWRKYGKNYIQQFKRTKPTADHAEDSAASSTVRL